MSHSSTNLRRSDVMLFLMLQITQHAQAATEQVMYVSLPRSRRREVLAKGKKSFGGLM